MRHRIRSLLLLTVIFIGAGCGSVHNVLRMDADNLRVRDLMWAWGNPEMTEEGVHEVTTFAQASPSERADILGVPNVILAGMGLPGDDTEAEDLTKQVAHCPHLIWEISTDSGTTGPPFIYRKTIARIRNLGMRYPQIEGILLDDMTSVGIDHGFKPEHIREVRRLLGPQNEQIKVWGVVYTMNLNREGIEDYIRELDTINLWTWHAKDIPEIENNLEFLESRFPEKPIVLGLYLYDYGDNRRMTLDLLERQCETALALARDGRIQGIVFLTIKNDAETVAWTAEWISRIGDTPIKR